MNNQYSPSDIYGILQKAESFFITATVRDKGKSLNNLQHFTLKRDFPVDDILPSIDHSLMSLGIVPEQPVEVIKPNKVYEKKHPLKIAIITHFNRCPDSYSPGRAVRNQIKLLKRFGHEVVFFIVEGSQLEVDCEMRKVVPRFKRQKNVVDKEAKQKFIKVLQKELTDDFDIAITHDLYIDDCITYREAIKECGIDIPWVHWARSGVGHQLDFEMPNARYVYMNYADVGIFSRMIGVCSDRVRVVFNEKDPSFLFNWDPITIMIADKFRLWEKDIIQAYPICTTRMDAKGLNNVIRAFAALKRTGKNVALVICNSNGRRRLEEIDNKIKYAKQFGLNADEIVFTSTLSDSENDTSREIPNKVVAELLQISNLFIFPTLAEVCSNILLEASMTKNLLVLNEDLPCLFDFVEKGMVLSHRFSSLQGLHFGDKGDVSFDELAKKINNEIEGNKADRQFRKVWRTHNVDTLYHEQLEPILYEQPRNKKRPI